MGVLGEIGERFRGKDWRIKRMKKAFRGVIYVRGALVMGLVKMIPLSLFMCKYFQPFLGFFELKLNSI